MPLSPAALKGPIVQAFSDMAASPRMDAAVPLLHDQLCQAVAAAYDTWFKEALGDLMPVITIGPGALALGLRPTLMANWGPAFAAYSIATTFLPVADEVSGVIVNAPAQGAAFGLAIADLLPLFSLTVEAFAKGIATLLATYTTGLVVQVALNHPPGTKSGAIL